MPDDTPTLRSRIARQFRMGQDPEDRLWSAIYVLISIAILLFATVVFYAEEIQDDMMDSRGLGFERGALVCQQVILDNERTSGIPHYCGRFEVQVYLPPEACEEFFPDSYLCGAKWVEA